MDIAKKSRNVISFCSGYAGIEQGLSLAGLKLRTLAYVEIEAFAIANLVAKMESGKLDAAPVWSNLKTFPAQLFRDRVDILTAGYPCQPFSHAGKRAGKDDPRHLWPYIREHVQAIRPVRCFFENVEGHISLGLREVIEDLESLGYKTTWGIFSASEVGAPHQRKRVYIMADSASQFGQRGIAEGVGRRKSQKAIGDGGAFESMADSNNAGQQSSERQGQARHDIGRRGQELADTDDSGNRTSKCRDMSEDGTQVHEGQDRDAQSGPSRCGEELADTNGTLSERRWVSSGVHQKYPLSNSSCASVRREATQQWLPEPSVLRVVDGCADRVDRLRLLGNAVVPQTAARAWEILSEELTK